MESPEFHPAEENESAESMRSTLNRGQLILVVASVMLGMLLGALDQTFYGDPNGWFRIYEANRDKISDPNRLEPGTRLVIPPETAPMTPVSQGATGA